MEEKGCLQESVTIIYNWSPCVSYTHFANLGFKKLAQSIHDESFP